MTSRPMCGARGIHAASMEILGMDENEHLSILRVGFGHPELS